MEGESRGLGPSLSENAGQGVYIDEDSLCCGMGRVNRILAHSLFRDCLCRIEEAERERIYCKHDMRHFLDTARLAWIGNLEQGLGMEKEMIYAAALLHDIGRAKQYACGMPHDAASAELICRIMPECGFSAGETAEVAAAVTGHSQSRGEVLEERNDEKDKVKAAGAHDQSLSPPFDEKDRQNCENVAAKKYSPDCVGAVKAQDMDRGETGRPGMRKSLGILLREADHASRSCFCCGARESCYWTDDRKNLLLRS